MRSGWIRVFVFVVVAALLANAQCFGYCFSAACGSAQTPPNSCHHQKPSQGDPAPCPHQHSEFSGPEVGIAKISLETTTILILPVLAGDLSAAVTEPPILIRSDSGSPPVGGACSTISVLRI
jgi:hypothetical protein